MKKALLTPLIIGVILGILQARFVKEDTKTVKMPTYSRNDLCGPAAFCLPDITGYHDEQVTYNERQGFPISKPGVHEFNPTHMDTLDYQAPLFANFFIFVLSIPLITFLGYRLVNKINK